MSSEESAKTIKCLVWDLDQTVWDGVLLESGARNLRPGVLETLCALDERGILHSVASKNEPDAARARLEELGIDHFFLFPQIGWGSKSGSVQAISESLNIGLDTLGFIDDQEFERDEVGFQTPQVRRYCASLVANLPDRPEFQPARVTEDSRRRRVMYQADQIRSQAEESFNGPQESFLETLGMHLQLEFAGEADLARAEELTLRTNQLNTTGRTYSYDELNGFRQSDQHILMTARLSDKYGEYGVIGLALLEKSQRAWVLRLLLMSCRVLSRGVGGVFLNYFRSMAQAAEVDLFAEFVRTDRNRMMFVTFRFAGFREAERAGESLLQSQAGEIPPNPRYLKISAPESLASVAREEVGLDV